MTWLAWSAIKGPLLKAAPWLGLVAAILIGWHIAAVHYRSQGRAEVQATANVYKQQRDTWVFAFHASDANFRTAMGMANDEAANIMALKAEGDARVKRAVAERDEALKANRSLTAQAANLRDSAKRHYSSGEPCSSSAALLNSKEL